MNSVNLDKYSDPFFLGETKEELRRIRQDFHVHPEIGLVTPRTSRIIADLLKDYGVDEVHEGVGGRCRGCHLRKTSGRSFSRPEGGYRRAAFKRIVQP